MSGIPLEKWESTMTMPKFIHDRVLRWKGQRIAYFGPIGTYYADLWPPSIWVQKDRILYPLNPKMRRIK
jgi:hypothetical protein